MAHTLEKSVHPLAGKHIIISGGGIAGLAFARGLSRNWQSHAGPKPRISVYERDPRTLPAVRGNYSLGLRSDKSSLGLQALQRLGLIDEIYRARTKGSEIPPRIRDAKWNTIMQMKVPATPPDDLPGTHMRITRNTLRECLIEGIDEDVGIHWQVSCVSAAKTKSDAWEVRLSDNTLVECDLLVVADGASSKLRHCLRPNDTLKYAGATMIGGNATFPEGQVPRQLQEGHGPMLGGDGHGLIVFHISDTSYVWFVTQRSDLPRTPIKGDEALQQKDKILQMALSEGTVFAEPFPTIVAHTDPFTLKVMNAQDKAPIVHAELDNLSNVVFIGDANHAVSPFAGNGANMALKDGASLSEALCNSTSVQAAIEAFDKESLPTSKGSLKKSHIVIRMAHSTGWMLWLACWMLRIVNWVLVRRP